MTQEQIDFVGINTTVAADEVVGGVAIFEGKTILTPPTGFVIDQTSFQVYINGVVIQTVGRTVTQVGSNIQVTFNNLDYSIDSQDQVILVGKFS
jgi:hypothetical protein